MGKKAYYFSHDANARNDEKILMLRAEHGWEGYGVYWVLIEMMFEAADTCLYHGKAKGIAIGHNIDITLLYQIINTCIAEGLFESDNERFWSESLMRRKAKMQELIDKRSEAGKKGMAKRWGFDNTVITEDNTSNNTVITKNNKGKEIKENKKDIDAYFEECWQIYPRKTNKGQISDLVKAKRFKMGDEFKRCIERYKKDLKKNNTEQQYIKAGSTFWNSGYLDYTDESISDSVKEAKAPPKEQRIPKFVLYDRDTGELL